MAQTSLGSTSRSGQRTVLHLDMDCFFASVAALTDPSLKGLPLAVCHSNSAHGTGEVSHVEMNGSMKPASLGTVAFLRTFSTRSKPVASTASTSFA